MPRPLDDLGPDFEQRWKRASRSHRRELIAELRDLYFMLEDEDEVLLSHIGVIPKPANGAAAPARSGAQGSLFTDNGTPAEPSPTPRRENPFLPRSVLARLQESQHQASAGLRDLMQAGQDFSVKRLGQAASVLTTVQPLSPEQAELERELRLRLGPVVEDLLDAQLEILKNELRVRLRAEMDRLIAEHVRK